MYLNSSNLHYSAKVTPFSLYITVRKKFRETSLVLIPPQTSPQPSQISLPSEKLYSLKKDFENELKQKALECNELKVAKELIENKLEILEDANLDLKTELEEKTLESHELKVTNEMLQKKTPESRS